MTEAAYVPTAAKATQAEAEQVVGRKLPSDLFSFDQLWGRRILVVREQEDTKSGLIVIPETAQIVKTTGWVIAAGPDVGIPDQALALQGWSPFIPAELLLKKVLLLRQLLDYTLVNSY